MCQLHPHKIVKLWQLTWYGNIDILNTFLNNCALLVYVVFSIRVCLNDMPHVSPVSSFIYIWGIHSVMIYLNIYPLWKYFAHWQSHSILNSDDSVLLQFVQGKILRIVRIVIYKQWHVYTVVSALVFKTFLFVFGMKLLICVLYEVPQEG